MRIYEGIEQLIGSTPLMRLSGFTGALGLNAEILGKLECFNPAGSVKDRVAKAMIEDAEQKGLLTAGSVIIEPTSGNTGIGLAAVGVHRGYRVILTMPDTMSTERRALLKAYGAELVLTDGSKGMAGAIQKAEELAASIPHSFIPAQFENPANPAAHLASTGVEIWEDSGGSVDIFVSGAGTGGTISGVGAYLKSMRADIRVVAVEPADSPVLSGGKAGPHELQGIGAGFVPKTLDKSVIDEVMAITGKEAYDACRTMARTEGLLVGISAGAALAAAAKLALKRENAGRTIAVLLPDGGEKYLSTPAFS